MASNRLRVRDRVRIPIAVRESASIACLTSAQHDHCSYVLLWKRLVALSNSQCYTKNRGFIVCRIT